MSTEEVKPVIVENQPTETPVVEPTIETPVAETPIQEVPTEPTSKPSTPERTWVEEIEIAGSQLVESLKELIAEGKVRRLIIRTAEDKVMLEIPLTAGVAVGGVVTFFAPVLAALGALAALLTRVKVQIVRAEE